MNEPIEIKKLFDSLLSSQPYEFPRKGTAIKLSGKQGVYIIFSPKEEVLHVGTTKRAAGGLDQRLNDHRVGKSSFRKDFLRPNKMDLAKGCYFKIIELENSRQRVLLESLTTGLLCPKHIGTGAKD